MFAAASRILKLISEGLLRISVMAVAFTTINFIALTAYLSECKLREIFQLIDQTLGLGVRRPVF